jgi:hypothetical protein
LTAVIIFGFLLMVGAVGIILILTDNVKAGAIIYLISSFCFIPIGIIGVIGARKLLDKLIEEDFLKRK